MKMWHKQIHCFKNSREKRDYSQELKCAMNTKESETLLESFMCQLFGD
jgi:hypothetical protein